MLGFIPDEKQGGRESSLFHLVQHTVGMIAVWITAGGTVHSLKREIQKEWTRSIVLLNDVDGLVRK